MTVGLPTCAAADLAGALFLAVGSTAAVLVGLERRLGLVGRLAAVAAADFDLAPGFATSTGLGAAARFAG